MNKMQEVIDAINAISKKYYKVEHEDKTWRSPYRQWDRIIGTVCLGCGRRLGKHENRNNLAFCFYCREILFPETITPSESWRHKFGNRRFFQEPFNDEPYLL